MKTVIAMLAMVFSMNVMAYEVPQDAVIKVFDSKGRQIGTMSRKDYKVVKIEPHPAPSVSPSPAPQEKVVVVDSRKDKVIWSAIVSGGPGKDGVEYEHSNSNHIVREHDAAVGMAQLCATRNKLGLCAHATTNQFYGLGLKLDFN